jgi:uncharacterized protein
VSTQDRGFASMNRDKQREIASKGGRAAHEKGRAHEWTKEEAREAGRKGGLASRRAKHQDEAGATPWQPGMTSVEVVPSSPVDTQLPS